MSEDVSNEQRYFDALKRIARYMTPNQIRRDADNMGLDYVEYLEMTYENVQSEAKSATKGKRRPQ
jgi:hypothetical protein